ncbi:4-hydroxyproline epimerase [Herpetosiphon geysericola]
MMHIAIIDSHTAGEPTRIVISGGPELGGGTVAEQRAVLAQHYDWLRSAVVNEPRGSDVLVGAILCQPSDQRCCTGVIFFNNVGYLGMCGHGTIGLVATLAHLGKIGVGEHLIETPVGIVSATLHPDGQATIENVPSYRYRANVALDLPNHGRIHGDIAWGGNWFFLVNDHGQDLSLANVEQLTNFSWQIRQALEAAKITGANNDLIDHIELFGAGTDGANSRSFVLCPGKAYDRSPCGTGTSAKLACLAADGKLAPNTTWVQESIIGSRFHAEYRNTGEAIIPKITGSAYVTLEGQLILHEADPFRWGIQ